jgi:putative membrane protein
MNTLQGLALFAGYLALSLTLLSAFTMLYIAVTPYDDLAAIGDGKMAPAIALSGAMLGFTFPLVTASYLHTGIPGFVFWALISCAVQLCVFWSMYRLLPRAITADNAAGALCYAVAAVCVGLLNAASFIP